MTDLPKLKEAFVRAVRKTVEENEFCVCLGRKITDEGRGVPPRKGVVSCIKCGKQTTKVHECQKRWRENNREHDREYKRERYKKNKEKILEARRKYHAISKKSAIERYSNGSFKCVCCGESTYKFLTIDHINNDGFKYRKEICGRLHDWLRKNNYPKGFQVLCFNCNCGKSVNKGTCPHKDTLS